MFTRNTDRNWEKLGETDPYWAVLTHEKYRKLQLTDESRDDFFKSGYEYVDLVLRTIRERLVPDYSPTRALDFGCGVGRLVIPLSEAAESVIGADVSPAMLREARKNCEARRITNVELVKSDDDLSSISGTFDLVHSVLVFQHIPVKRGERIFRNLIGKTRSGGVCVVHFTYAMNFARGLKWLVGTYVPFAANAINLVKGRSLSAPRMEMNRYDVNRLLAAMQTAGIGQFHAELIDQGGVAAVAFYFRKP